MPNLIPPFFPAMTFPLSVPAGASTNISQAIVAALSKHLSELGDRVAIDIRVDPGSAPFIEGEDGSLAIAFTYEGGPTMYAFYRGAISVPVIDAACIWRPIAMIQPNSVSVLITNMGTVECNVTVRLRPAVAPNIPGPIVIHPSARWLPFQPVNAGTALTWYGTPPCTFLEAVATPYEVGGPCFRFDTDGFDGRLHNYLPLIMGYTWNIGTYSSVAITTEIRDLGAIREGDNVLAGRTVQTFNATCSNHFFYVSRGMPELFAFYAIANVPRLLLASAGGTAR